MRAKRPKQEEKDSCLVLTNLKSSSKIDVPANFNLNTLRQRCEYDFNFKCKPYPSYLVIKSPTSSLRYIIFKRKAGAKTSHCNLTGVSTFIDHIHALDRLADLLQCDLNQIETEFDNISGSINTIVLLMKKLGIKNIDLSRICKALGEIAPHLHLKYNTEIYGCLVISIKKAETFLLFDSGRLTVCGGADIVSMIEASKWLTQQISHVIMNM